MNVRLQKTEAYRYQPPRGKFHYEMWYNHASGRKNRYELVIVTEKDPLVIGRELDLDTCRFVIKAHEMCAPKFCIGSRADAEATAKRVQKGNVVAKLTARHVKAVGRKLR